jgi:hypothetical protein
MHDACQNAEGMMCFLGDDVCLACTRLEGWLADNGCSEGLLPLLGNSSTVFNGDVFSIHCIHTPAIKHDYSFLMF